MINDRLVEAVISGQNLPEDVEPFDCYMSRSVPQPNHPTTNPKTLLTYSASPTTATSLRRGCFYKYGIPRVKLDPQRNREERFGSTSSMSSSGSADQNSHSSQSSLSDEELALDYFYYEKPATKRDERINQRRFGSTVDALSQSTNDTRSGNSQRTICNARPTRSSYASQGAAANRSNSCSGSRTAERFDYNVKARRNELMRFHMDNL